MIQQTLQENIQTANFNVEKQPKSKHTYIVVTAAPTAV